MDRRTLIKGLAALAPVLSARRLFAETPSGAAAKSCRLITQDIAGPFLQGRAGQVDHRKIVGFEPFPADGVSAGIRYDKVCFFFIDDRH